ncbi:MAG: regulatory signaling modulator protein AmpE [Xanthomonadales bacterium]|nr:regulatory signaling modulator protein AmpE [Xanthomonadales bacterium]
MTILAILIAFALTQFFPLLSQYRGSGWLQKYVRKANDQLSILPGWAGISSVILLPLIPLALLYLLAQLSTALLGGFGLFILSILVLLYTFGPRDLDADIKAYLSAQTREEKNKARAHLQGPACDSIAGEHSHESESLEETDNCPLFAGAVFQQALRRWFAIIFWFAIAGIAGALAYRIIEWLTHRALPLSDRQRQNFSTVCSVMEWPVAQLMTLSLAIAADFDSVYSAWKQYHDEQGHSLFEGNNGFLRAAANCIIVSGSVGNDGFADQLESEPNAVVQQAMDLVWRVMGVWLAGLAILLLAGWLS